MVQRIFLIGYMTSGKSFIGRTLSPKFKSACIDLDDIISTKAGQSIANIFSSQGEEQFRILEHNALKDIEDIDSQRIIISTGGGTPCFENNMDIMNQLGTTIFLNCPPEIIVERLIQSKNIRPIVEEIPKEDLLAFVYKHLESRRSFYEKAHFIVDIQEEKSINLQSVSKVIEEIFNPSIP